MILVNKVEVALDKLDARLGLTGNRSIPLKKILKKPLYEINKALIHADPANGLGATKHRNAMEFPAVFRTQLASGENVEIRYCTNRTPDVKFMGQTEKFAPRVVEFEGKAEFIADDNDKAVYFFLHFYCKQSPFPMATVPHDYELVDDEGRANVLIESIVLRNKATSHASSLEGDEMIIIAKGMRIAGSSSMDPMMLKAQLMQFANDKPAEYLNKAESQVNHIEGLILDSIDKGIFVVENVFNSKRWKWGMGVKTGELIVEMSTSVTDENQSLITHISQHIQEFLPVLINTSKTINAKANLTNALEGVNIFEMLGTNKSAAETPAFEVHNTPAQSTGSIGALGTPPIVNTTDTVPANSVIAPATLTGTEPLVNTDAGTDSPYLPFPASYAEAQEYMGKHIGKKTPALASKLFKGIEDGSVSLSNIEMVLAELKTA